MLEDDIAASVRLKWLRNLFHLISLSTMPEGQSSRNRDRSVSGDFEVCFYIYCCFLRRLRAMFQDTDFESHAGDANPPGKPGRKKNPK